MRAAAVDDLVEVEHGRSFGLSPATTRPGPPLQAGPGRRLAKPRRIAYLAAMALRPILIHPDPRLRKVAEPVAAIDDGLRALASDMLATMYDAPGIGLAATQLGVMKRVFVMDCAGGDEPKQPMVLVNPEITWASEETVTSEEGCLSIPEIYDDVTRAERVRVRWLGLDGLEHEQEFGERWAICAQHELDHLNGRLFIDYLSGVKRAMITSKMKKLKKELARA
jgi:peptide deformylase